MLKMTDKELELISDIDMNLFTEKGMRGGISDIAKRFSKTNNKYNKYMKCYDSSKPSIYIYIYIYIYIIYKFKWLKWLDSKG